MCPPVGFLVSTSKYNTFFRRSQGEVFDLSPESGDFLFWLPEGRFRFLGLCLQRWGRFSCTYALQKSGTIFGIIFKKYTMLMHLRFYKYIRSPTVEPSLSASGGKWESSLSVGFGGMCIRAALLWVFTYDIPGTFTEVFCPLFAQKNTPC